MSGATSPENDSRARNIAAFSQGQCTPMPLPSLGTRRIIQGNGTNVGTVISLLCPDQHRLIGNNMECVMRTNSTQWVGETYCRPMSGYGELGHRVAVLASVVSAGIILMLSMAFVTCCLHDRFKKKKTKRRNRKRDIEEEEWLRYQCMGGRTGSHHHSRNHNNNNSHRNAGAMGRGGHDTAFVDDKVPCGSCLHPYCDLTAPPSTPLPGESYNPPPATRDIRLDRDAAGPLQNSRHLQNNLPAPRGPPCQTARGARKSGSAQSLSACSSDGRGADAGRQFGGQEHRMSLLSQHASQETYIVNSNKECSIRIITV